MIYFDDLTSLSLENKNKFIRWKGDEVLADLIMSYPSKINIQELDNWILKNSKDPNQYFKCVFDRTNNKLIGLARLMFIDKVSCNAEIGLYIGDDNDRKNNLGSKILDQLIFVAREKFNLNKVYAKISEKNSGSIKLFMNAGFLKEGSLREHYYSRIRNEFDSVFILSKFI